MSNFRRDRGSQRGKRKFSDREMFKAVCDECGNKCEVPFKPSSDKPIYCSDCFERKEGNKRRGDGRRDGRSGGDRRGLNKQILNELSSLNNKMDKLIEILGTNEKNEKPSKKKKVVKKDKK